MPVRTSAKYTYYRTEVLQTNGHARWASMSWHLLHVLCSLGQIVLVYDDASV